MPGSSKNSLKNGAKSKVLRKPSKESIVRKAKMLVADYRIILERTEQVNVRLTAEEKLLFTNAAMNLGFKGISDFIRNTALNSVLSGR